VLYGPPLAARERPAKAPGFGGRPAAQRRCRYKLQSTAGASAKAQRVPSLANPLPSGKEQCGAAKWPRLRRHLAGKISHKLFPGTCRWSGTDGPRGQPKV